MNNTSNYYIVGKTSSDGPTNDMSGNNNVYYELGWELMFTHTEIKKLKFYKTFQDDDVVVTANEDRKYLYTSYFNNVITWEEFLKLNIPSSNVVDLVYESEPKSQSFAIRNHCEDDLINVFKNFKKSDEISHKITDKKFICLQYRNRKWASNRNVDDDFFKNFVDLLSNKYNYNVFIMGLGSEKFCNELNIFYVNLQEFTTLINHENCLLYYSSLSGPAHLSCFFSHKNLVHIVNDINGVRNYELINEPLYQGEKYNYNNIDVRVIPHLRSVDFYEDILLELINKQN